MTRRVRFGEKAQVRGPSEVVVTGPLAPWAPGYIDELAALGYASVSAADQLRLMAHVSRWLDDRGLDPHQLTPRAMAEFLEQRRRAGYASRLSKRATTPLLAYLERLRVATLSPEPACTPVDALLERYCRYLRDERGLTESSVQTYEPVARRFLDEYFGQSELDCRGLTAEGVTRFVQRRCRSQRNARLGILVPVLRSVLRFLHLEGKTEAPLADAVPKIAGWRLSSLPRTLERGQVLLLVQSCDRRTALGRRDHAILLLLSRLGLRASEVCALALQDVEWRRGEIVIHGKGRREDVLPLPDDAGRAIAAYLQRGRPRISSRFIFLRDHAPYRELTRSAVGKVVYRACDRAGLSRVGPHRLRHTAASLMISGGTPLADIAEVLRHRDVATTAIYAKVDRDALRHVAQPWPGGTP